MIVRGTATARARAISSARFAATIRIPSTSWRFRAMRKKSSASSNGATARKSPRRHMAEAPASSAASSPESRRLSRRGVDRSDASEPGHRGGQGLARGKYPGRRARSRSRGAAETARLTLRHYPQSFEFSTLGGWIATRSGGHYATNYTHIDDFVESMRVITPTGTIESRRLPGSGAGPSPDRMFIGSEGILGIITSAWMRLQDRPKFRIGASVPFPSFFAAAKAVRQIRRPVFFPRTAASSMRVRRSIPARPTATRR